MAGHFIADQGPHAGPSVPVPPPDSFRSPRTQRLDGLRPPANLRSGTDAGVDLAASTVAIIVVATR